MSLYAVGVHKLIIAAGSRHELVDDVLTRKTLCKRCKTEVPEDVSDGAIRDLVRKFSAPCPDAQP